MTSILSLLQEGFDQAQLTLFEHFVEPLVQAVGAGGLAEDAFDATAWLLIGLANIGTMLLVLAPLESWRPVEPVTDRSAVRVDRVYTLIHRLGLVPLLFFFALQPAWDAVSTWARLQGLPTFQLDALLAAAWAGITDQPLFAFALYLFVFDGLDYAVHRAQHAWSWWWCLHAVHHSQRQMTMWSDDRAHLVDDALHATVLALAARIVGVPPGQFMVLVAVSQWVQSLSHANVRLRFGWLGDRLLVSPRYHRAHHAAEPAPAPAAAPQVPPSLNFATLFPAWDLVFGTARFVDEELPTGIRDQWPEHGGKDYGQGFWSQQWRALDRLRRCGLGWVRAVPWRRHD